MRQEDDDLSYDPRSWLRPAAAPPVTSPPSPRPPLRPRAPARVRRKAAPAPAPALLAGLAIALAGAGAAYRAREAAPAADPSAPPAGARGAEDTLFLRTLVVPGLADLSASLRAADVPRSQVDAAVAAASPALKGQAGELRLHLALSSSPGGTRLRALTATRTDGAGVHLTASSDGRYAARRIDAHLVERLAFVRGELDGESFYTSAVAAGISDVLVGEFANAFRYDFDMQREVSKGDVFEAGFEQRRNAQGEPVGLPTLVYASLSTAAKSRSLYRSAGAEWFDASGRSSRRALMRTPVEAARISSGFGMRGHPILGFVKMHKGTDFAAPIGTPIFAAGDGIVTFAAPKGPNGNFVRLHHDNGWDTLYLHMNRFAPGLAAGQRVVQGQQIGEVGTTGRSTGPHLHYEVHIAGQPVDPLSIDTGTGKTLTGKALAAFLKLRDRIDAARATVS